MPTQREQHQSEMQKHAAAARRILSKAKDEGRPVSPDEAATIDAHVAAVETRRLTIERNDGDKARRDLVNSLGSQGHIAGMPYVGNTLGAALTASAEYTNWREGIKRGDAVRLDSTVEMFAAAGDPVLEGTGSNATAIAPTWLQDVAAPGLGQWPDMIQSVLPIEQVVEGNTVYWPRATTRNIADMTDTAEAENKAGAEFAFDAGSKQLSKWTAFSAVSDELAQDAPALMRYIDTEMVRMALQKEERAIAQSLYSASTTFATGAGVTTAPAGYDMVLEAMVMIRVAGGVPNAILINPYDWASLSAAKASTAGTYFGGGPYARPSDALWGGVRQVQTPVAPRGTPLVGDFTRGCTLYRKGGARLESSNSHDSYFRQDLIALRAEVRSALVVFNPDWLVEASLGS